jgi:hypothetical protein
MLTWTVFNPVGLSMSLGSTVSQGLVLFDALPSAFLKILKRKKKRNKEETARRAFPSVDVP